MNNINAEIYYPPYLFTTNGSGASVLAARPTIGAVSGQSFGYGASMTLTLSSGDQIASASVIGLSSTTHSFNTGQRFIPAGFRQSGQTVSVTLPGGAATAPPGYYMVFLVNQAGVPSRGTIIALGGATAPVAGPAGSGQIWANIGVNTTRLAHGDDGTTVVVSTDGTLWMYAGDGNWNNVPAPAKMTDVAIVKRNSIYAQDGNGAVWRYNGSAWNQVGVRSFALGASSDGTVIVTSFDKTMWAKSADDDTQNWRQVPAGLALRAVPVNGGSIWLMGTDHNVYHFTPATGSVKVGVSVVDIAASSDGFILVANSQSNGLWLQAGDTNAVNWTNVPNQTASALAIARGGRLVTIGTDGNVYRK